MLGFPLDPLRMLIEDTSLLVIPVTPRLAGAMVDRKAGLAGLERSTTWTPVLDEVNARLESGSKAGISAPARATLPFKFPEKTPFGSIGDPLPVMVTRAGFDVTETPPGDVIETV